MISWMKKGLIATWKYRPIWHPLKQFGSEVYESAENIVGIYAEAGEVARCKVKGGNHSILKNLLILNSFSESEYRQHYADKPETDRKREYLFHGFAFYFYLPMLAWAIHYQLTIGTTTSFVAMLCGALAISIFSVLIPLYAWRCWQARVGGNYPPSRFAAALLRNPLNIFP
ncbi:MAG: hypothetical protein N0C91_10145 [Candidatus Thiodiazotropha endolucinida]|nr:hypothetical protein [Candidatus Thiodiazotropha taylori]MCG8119133.1 hypothetical protein [Candidatus Thiodiazotropha taylori]MCW4288063.1 hypothetical protein [Candidatus Thiodiazotropha endolucinida]MCW4294819.1 hypothetical protein [Candidatus Thiodiazotropha endolucinida]